MPAISFEFNSKDYDEELMKEFGESLDQALRHAIRYARQRGISHEYKVFVRGRPQGPITYHVPAMEIIVRYHAGWEFSRNEVALIGKHLAGHVRAKLQGLNQPVDDVKIRFYIEYGYQGFEV